MMSKTAAEPLVRISKREGATFVQKVLVRAIAILLALVVDAFFIFFVTGLNPISVYGVMWNGTFMNTTRFSWALRDLSSLLCIAIALAPAFKMRFWNIGGEGQVLIGGLVAALIMVYFGSSLPAPLLFAAMVIGSVLAGAIWAFVPAWFKSRWNTNETLFTLMMNYVATSIVACMTNIMRGQASSLGTLNKATKAGWLPVINGQRYTINIIVVLVLTFAMYAYLKYSKQGYEISVVGESENTARYAGINVSRVMIRTMLLSGAICGLCGFLVVAGKDQTISTTSAGGNGFTAIIVAWLAKFNTFYMMLISFLLIFLDRGASEIASAYSLNEYAADIITGIILFFILIGPAIYGYTHNTVYYDLAGTLPKSLESITANDKLEEQYHMGATHMVLLNKDTSSKDVVKMTKEMEQVDGVNAVLSLDSVIGTTIPKSMLPSDIVDVFESGDYKMMLIMSEYAVASDEVNAQCDTLKKIVKEYDETGMLIGEAPCTKDLITITNHDFNVVSTVSIGAIFLIIACVFKSISLPIILVSVIEFAIFINMGIPAFTGTKLPFIAGIVIGTIQLGATVDYAILMTTKYRKARYNGVEKQEAITSALGASMQSVIVSALSFFAATFGVGLYSNVDMIASLCSLMARGAIISMFVVIFILPSMFMIFDKIICKTSKGFVQKN